VKTEGRVRTFGNGNLQLENVTLSDEGSYTCSWTGLATRAVTVSLSVIGGFLVSLL
jgi:hypothetical protein